MITASRILIIEEDPPIRELLSGLLTDEGYEVRIVQNGAPSLEMEALFDPDLIVLDLRAPYYAETAFLYKYHDRPGRHVPIIGMGTSRYRSAYTEVVHSKIDCFLSMPFNLDDFLRQIRRFLPTVH